MKVAFIRYRYDPYGGAERFTQLLMEHLVARGDEVHLYARRWKDATASGPILHRVGGPGWPAILAYASFVVLVGRAVRQGRYDLIQSNERTLCQHVYRAGDGVHARWLEVRLGQLGWLRRCSIHLNPFHRLRLWLERALFESPELKAVIVNSNMVRDEILARFRIDADRIHTIYNGVDLKRFHPSRRGEVGEALRNRAGLAGKTPVLLFVGSGFERKGLEPLLRAAARSNRGAHVWVVGKGRSSHYESLARRLGIDSRVIFWGPQQDVVPFYAGADFCVLPTLYDPFPSVVLEAMASALPVITTRQCGAAEIIDEGADGFVVSSPSDVETMADRIARLCESGLRQEMGRAARRKAEQFPIEHTIGELKHLYDRLLSAQ
ncbi:MAG: glycosyltransferase family 4 protein [Syntrophobacteraceae bacterium]